MSPEIPNPPQPPRPESQPPVSAAEQISQPDQGEAQLVQDAAQEFQQIPDPQTLGSQDFLQARSGTLRGVWNKAKDVAGKIGEYFSIEHEGHKLSPMENVRTRFANFGVLCKAANARSNEERREIMSTWSHNPVAQNAAANANERLALQDRSSDENFADRRLFADTAKIAAYELTTLPVVRMAGLMALHGAAKAAEKLTGSENATKVKDKTAYRLELHEQGLHNPTIRKLNGLKWREIKPSSKAPEEPPVIDRRTTDLTSMDDETVVRMYYKNPFAPEDEESQLITTTAGRLRNPFDEGKSEIPQEPRAKIRDQLAAKADSSQGDSDNRQPVSSVSAERRNPFWDD